MEYTKNYSGRVYEELLLERGLYPGVETSDQSDEVDVLDGGGAVEGVGLRRAVVAVGSWC
jgi:hypothetical protein